jgi:uncharacterized protein with GYD domain
MPTYIGYVSYTPGSWGHIIDEDIDRVAAIRDIVEHAGGTLKATYWLFAEHDLLGILELPDDVDALAVCYAAYSSGALKHIEIHPVVEQGDIAKMQRRAKEFAAVFKHVTHPDSPRHG